MAYKMYVAIQTVRVLEVELPGHGDSPPDLVLTITSLLNWKSLKAEQDTFLI